MTLIKSISGIRGTIGGKVGENLTPVDVVKFSAAFAAILQKKNAGISGGGAGSSEAGIGGENAGSPITMLVGRDGRISGEMVQQLVVSTLCGMGVNVVDVGLSTTPTVEMEVVRHKAQGGIIITASHNPKEWNALKLLGASGEFISAEEGAEVLRLAETVGQAENTEQYEKLQQQENAEQTKTATIEFASIDKLGSRTVISDAIEKHIEKILQLPLVNIKDIAKQNFKVVIDGINSTGGEAISELLIKLGVTEITILNAEPTGNFAHNPEPLPENLTQISAKVKEIKADLGIVVDPDVDRLAFVCEDGTMFGEEYTLVAVADYILKHKKGAVVSNLSSSRALRDIAEKHGCTCYSSAVGEVNVVAKMKEVNAVIGGEGNGGIIYPDLHYGRDALVGVAFFLTALAQRSNNGSNIIINNSNIIINNSSSRKLTEWRKELPQYVISKNKISLSPNTDINAVLEALKKHFVKEKINTEDGVRIDFENTCEWVHLRRSNTEPIIRIYAESATTEKAEKLAESVKKIALSLV